LHRIKFLAENSSNNICLETLEINDVNGVKKNYTNLRNIYNSLNDKSSQPKLAGNQKHPHKLEKKVMSRKEIILNHKNETENEEEVMTDGREKDREGRR